MISIDYWTMGYNYEAVNGFKLFHFAHPLIGVLLGAGFAYGVIWFMAWMLSSMWRHPETWR